MYYTVGKDVVMRWSVDKLLEFVTNGVGYIAIKKIGIWTLWFSR